MHLLPATHPDDFPRLGTTQLRERFLAADLFAPGALRWALSADDRLLLGGASPDGGELRIEAPEELHTDLLCRRRELAVVALDDDVVVTADGQRYELALHDVLYVGQGTRDLAIGGRGRGYLVSAPAHAEHPTTLVRRDEAASARLGESEQANVRTIRRFVHADGVRSANLVLGITTLEPGSVWNTMPPHTHHRRTEVYLYTGLEPDARVLHLAGQPDEIRSLVLAEGQAVVSPGWSIHSGVGTRAYSFVWAMAGENQDYADMDPVDPTTLR